MTKREFLDNLRTALSGRVSTSSAEEHVRYYEDYINTQVRMGRSEKEVVSELGDPRLLARSIEDADKRAGNAAQESYQDSYSDSRSENRGGGQNYGGYQENRGRSKGFRVHGWMILLIVLLIVLLVIGLAFSLLSFLMPIILPILLIVFAVRLFRRI